jgi:glycosyltransferase involved in cell wall biosynthesis
MLRSLDRGKIDVNEGTSSNRIGVPVRYAKFGSRSSWGKNLVGYLGRYFKAQSQMVRIGVDLKPEIIHAHDVWTLRVAKKIAGRTNAKVGYDCHELYRESSGGLTGVSGFMRNRMESWGLKKADLIIACNHYRAKIMVDEYGAARQPRIVKNAVQFRERDDQGYLRKQFSNLESVVQKIAVYQGGISASRCIEPMLEALAMVSNPTIGLALIGPCTDAYYNKIKLRIGELGLEQQAIILPPVDQRQLHPIACSADIGIVLYRNDCRNNFFCAPNKLQEYAMAGLAIIGAKNPPIESFIKKYEVGVTVEPESVDEIASAISSICNDDLMLDSMKQKSLKAAEQESWDCLSHTLIEAYQDAGLL